MTTKVEIGRAYSMYGKKRCILDIGGRIILEWILARYGWVVLTGFI
jgi:hypothetical protein